MILFWRKEDIKSIVEGVMLPSKYEKSYETCPTCKMDTDFSIFTVFDPIRRIWYKKKRCLNCLETTNMEIRQYRR